MDKLMNVLVVLGVLLLGIFLFINPLMGGTMTVICIPFFIVTLYFTHGKRKVSEELKTMVSSFQREKEEIINEIRRKEEKQKFQFERLKNYGKQLSSALNKDQLLHLIVEMFAKVTSATSGESQCFLLSREIGADEYFYVIGYNFDRNTLKSMEFKHTEVLIKDVVKSKKITTHISDIFGGDSNIRFFLKEEKITYLSQLGALALIPLVLEDDVWGIIVIFCHEEAAARIKNDESFFMLLLAQASIALGSAIHRGLASVDRLTQLYNRNFLQKRMKEEMEFCNRQLLPLSVMMIDIDHFKEVNDSCGHQEGDMVLKKIAQIISKSVRLTDVCARYGGEEFVVVLPGILECAHDKFSIAERLRSAVEKSDFLILGTKHIKITISVGVTVRKCPRDNEVNMDELIKRADTLLYQAKKEGRNKVCFSEL